VGEGNVTIVNGVECAAINTCSDHDVGK
jgi:hypothetical protein